MIFFPPNVKEYLVSLFAWLFSLQFFMPEPALLRKRPDEYMDIKIISYKPLVVKRLSQLIAFSCR